MDSVGASGDCNEIPSRENSKKPALEAPPKLQIKKIYKKTTFLVRNVCKYW